MKPVVIIAAMPQESVLLEHSLANTGRIRMTAIDYAEGTLGSRKIILCNSGVGKINAAMATTVMIERHHPGLLINTGCAGAYMASGLTIGSLAVASSELLGDEGVITPDGWKDLKFMNMPVTSKGGRLYYNEIPLSRHAAEKAMQLADCYGVPIMRGRFVTVSSCTGTREGAEELTKRFRAIAENMEGAAVAQVCLRYGVDCLEIRGISNLVDERDMKTWDIPRAVEAAQRFVLKYIEEMDRPDTTSYPLATPEI